MESGAGVYYLENQESAFLKSKDKFRGAALENKNLLAVEDPCALYTPSGSVCHQSNICACIQGCFKIVLRIKFDLMIHAWWCRADEENYLMRPYLQCVASLCLVGSDQRGEIINRHDGAHLALRAQLIYIHFRVIRPFFDQTRIFFFLISPLFSICPRCSLKSPEE